MRRRLPASIASAVGARSRITIRKVAPTDDAAVARLVALAGAERPAGALLAAEADGDLVAVAGPDGRAVTDPFRVTTDVEELLRLRASQLERAAA